MNTILEKIAVDTNLIECLENIDRRHCRGVVRESWARNVRQGAMLIGNRWPQARSMHQLNCHNINNGIQ